VSALDRWLLTDGIAGFSRGVRVDCLHMVSASLATL
jgi:hypothetical protein